MLERSEQERAELPLAAVGRADVVLFEQPREKLLSEILRVGQVVALAPNVSVKRVPIGMAELGQGLRGFRRRLLRRREHHAPMRRGELSGAAPRPKRVDIWNGHIRRVATPLSAIAI